MAKTEHQDLYLDCTLEQLQNDIESMKRGIDESARHIKANWESIERINRAIEIRTRGTK